jgi:hypothetical protein
MLAHSKTERLAILRKLAKSLSEKDPLPSAILFEILKAAALNYSPNLNKFRTLALSAMSYNLSVSSIDSCQTIKSSNLKSLISNYLNLTIISQSLPHALCP